MPAGILNAIRITMMIGGGEANSIRLPPVADLIADPRYRVSAIMTLAGIMFSVMLHEVGHAYMAHMMGDPTPAEKGRLTLNPVPHFKSSPFMMLILPVITWFMFGGTWALAGGFCPVNPNRMRSPRLGDGLTSLAGPSVMLLIAFLCAAVLMAPGIGFVGGTGPMNPVVYGIFLIGQANVILAVFNLLPIPPMDGSHVLTALIPPLKPAFDKLGAMGGTILVVMVGWPVMGRLFPLIMKSYMAVILKGYTLFAGG